MKTVLICIYFRKGLGKKFTEPVDSPDHSKFRLVDMFTSCTDQEVKTQLFTSLKQLPLQWYVQLSTLAWASIALMLGKSYTWYGQGAGCAGREGEPALALLPNKKKGPTHAGKSMVEYVKNTSTCHRDFLFEDMDIMNM